MRISSEALDEGDCVEAMPAGTGGPAVEAVQVERAKQLERTQWGLLLLSVTALMSWIPEVELLSFLVGAIAVILILLGTSAFGSRHTLLVWAAVVVFVSATFALFGIVASFAGSIRSIPSGASGPAATSQVLAAVDTFLYGSLVIGAALSLCYALIAFELEDGPGRVLLTTGVASQIVISLSLFTFVFIPLIHRAVGQAFATNPPDLSILTAASAQLRSLRGLAVLNSIPAVIFAGAYTWAFHRISQGAMPSSGAPPGRTSLALLAGIVGLIVLLSAAEVGALVPGALSITLQSPPSWKTAASFSGNRTGMTPTFTINGTQSQFSMTVIDYNSSSFTFSFKTYRAGTSSELGSCGMSGGPGFAGRASGGCGGTGGPGAFYLAITDTTGVDSWTITVSELV
jgi:hypothetical protein